MAGSGEFANKMTGHVIGQIEARLREAHLVSANAKSFSTQGMDERSIETLVGVEPLVFEANALLQAVTILKREPPV